MQIQHLEQRKYDKSTNKRPTLPSPKLVLAPDGQDEQFHTRFGKDEAHPAKYSGYGCI